MHVLFLLHIYSQFVHKMSVQSVLKDIFVTCRTKGLTHIKSAHIQPSPIADPALSFQYAVGLKPTANKNMKYSMYTLQGYLYLTKS
jgi:hypothetical protein